MNSVHNTSHRRVLFSTAGEWQISIFAGLLISALAWPWYKEISYSIGPVILLMVITVFNMISASRFMFASPHVAILIAGLQYVMAAWLGFYYPPSSLVHDIGRDLPSYLTYGTSATIAFAFGWVAVLWRMKPTPWTASTPSSKLLMQLDVLFFTGLFFGFVLRFVSIPSMAFLMLLFANLRYFGAIGRMMVKGKGWQWRIALTVFMEILLATKGGMFHTLLLWSASVFVGYLHAFKPRKYLIFICLLFGMLLLPAFQEAKWRIRARSGNFETQSFAFDSVVEDSSLLSSLLTWPRYLIEGVIKTLSGNLDADFLGDTAMRYNQGWIINRLMNYVPSEEPYARGETLLTAGKSALVPRILDPEKHSAGGRLYMLRFAGLDLTEGTSMNLGYAGELYVNFGRLGGVLGCFVYAAMLGGAYRWVALRAARSPLWWVFIPYVGSIAFKAEDGISEVLNWIVKATIVSAAVYWCFPAIRAALVGKAGFSEPELAKERFGSPRNLGKTAGRSTVQGRHSHHLPMR